VTFAWTLEVLRKERYDCADQARTVSDEDAARSLRATAAELDAAIELLEREAAIGGAS
jgi:hypothetical protein